MIRVGEFEKVGFQQFYEAMREEFHHQFFANMAEATFKEYILSLHDVLQLPARATSGSAGYDFKSPIKFTLPPHKSIKIPTGIRVQIKDGWWLACLPRSSLGFKYQAMLANTVGVIDADYYYSDNEGHIFIKLVNRGDKELAVNIGDSFAQAIFLPYGITYSDNAIAVRNGGMGSTGK